MDFTTRWTGEVTSGEKLADGDLATCVNGTTTYLCLRVVVDNRRGAVVLAEYGGGSGDQVPYLVEASALIDGLPVRRLRGGELIVAPLTTGAEDVLAPSGDRAISGSLGLLDGGDCAIRIGSGPGALTFDLKTGKSLHTLPDARIWMTNWRLLWVFGDESLELCRFPPAERARR